MIDLTIPLDSREESVLLSGNRDQFLKEIRQALDMQVLGRGDQLLFKGTQEQIDQAARIISRMRESLRHEGSLSLEEVRTIIEVVHSGGDRISAGLNSESFQIPLENSYDPEPMDKLFMSKPCSIMILQFALDLLALAKPGWQLQWRSVT